MSFKSLTAHRSLEGFTHTQVCGGQGDSDSGLDCT